MSTKYAQLADSLRDAIAAGEYRSTNRLPTEQQLMVQFGVSRQTVGSWRNGCGLPPIKPGPGVVFQYDWDRALTLYDRGFTDAQIADAIGCKWQTVVKWRRREGLPSKHRFKGSETE